MVVAEEIVVRALGEEIQRGIYRDFPTDFPRASGFGRIQAPFRVLSVERDGRREPWSVESVGGPGGRGGVRVRIGDPNVLLDAGEHSYVLRYETWRWVRFGDTEDQLYWNVTGNGWAFPILEASARVTFPGATRSTAVRLEAWTGPEGSTASDADWSWDADAATAAFRARSRQDPGSGLTVRLTFPKGVVAPPTPEQQEEWFRLDWGGYLDAATVAGLLLALYVLMWSRVGRDPEKRPLVVRYQPPPGFSPAALGYLQERGYRDRLFAAALVSLAVQGALRIERKKEKWTLRRLGARDEGSGPRTEPEAAPGGAGVPSAEERQLLSTLLGDRESMTLGPSYATTLRKAVKQLKGTLARQLEKHYFVLNRRWFLAGLALSVAGFAWLAWRDRYGIPPEAWFLGLWLTFWSIGVGTLLYRVTQAWRAALGNQGAGEWFAALFLSAFSLPFVGAEIGVLYILTTSVPRHLLLAAVVLGFLNVLFYHLLERPTLKGRGALDALEGFKVFLTATDADRLDRMPAPERTPALFERWLPHAIALGVEKRWVEAFEGVLAAGAAAGAGAATAHAGALAWYQGGSVSDLGSVASSLGSGLSSSLSAASSPPSSGGSGGGGGGGSSGGGGGGGGGGGW
jgi:uncharacterized membrane protein YgcG